MSAPTVPEFPRLETNAVESTSLVEGLSSLLTRLRGVGLEARVSMAGEPDGQTPGARLGPTAQVVALDWTDVPDGSSGLWLRRVRFRLDLGLSVAAPEPLTALAQLERLADRVIEAIDGVELVPGCVAALTGLQRARFVDASGDRRPHLSLDGAFSLVRSATGA